jgi:EF-P beta-lysylation protein EpmB
LERVLYQVETTGISQKKGEDEFGINHPNQTSDSVSDQSNLLSFLGLDINRSPYPLLEKPIFSFLSPETFIKNIGKNNWFDPLLLQIIAREEELLNPIGFVSDAVGDNAAMVVPGLLHKYAGRVLLLASQKCAIHCRYCLRRFFPFNTGPSTDTEWKPAWEYIQAHKDIHEVILSGGDPLMLTNNQISSMLSQIIAIDHIRIVRFHTRIPVVLPGRIEGGLLDLLKKCSAEKQTIIVIHANHAREIGIDCQKTLRALKLTGVLLLNQSVLLRGINDNAQTLAQLCLTLVENGVFPYALHQLDKVSGTSHFEVDLGKGREIMDKLRAMVPGYAVCRYVREIDGAGYKIPL